MKIKTAKVKGYSHLASFLVNGDASGLSDEELFEADMFVECITDEYGKSAYIVGADADDNMFGSPEYGGLEGDIIPYLIHY